MKKRLLCLLLCLAALPLSACGKSNAAVTAGATSSPAASAAPSEGIAAAAYSQLDAGHRAKVGDEKNRATVGTITLEKSMGALSDESYAGKEVWIVNFPSGTDSTKESGCVCVYLAKDTKKIVGYGYID